jgi:microcystin-dependent protein
MPVLSQFIDVAADMSGATVVLGGDSRAVLFSALAALEQLWQWTKFPALDAADVDYIKQILATANLELMQTMIGEIVMYTTAAAPAFTLPCDGDTYNREDYPELYAVLDAAYILDADTFVTPALQSRSPIGAGAALGLSTYTVNQIAGEESHLLVLSEIPSHSHGLFEFTALAVEPGELPVLDPNPLALRSSDSAGGDNGHNTIHPVNAVKFAVVYQ